MRKEYITPACSFEHVTPYNMIAVSITSVSSNEGFVLGDDSDEDARVKGSDGDWDGLWDE